MEDFKTARMNSFFFVFVFSLFKLHDRDQTLKTSETRKCFFSWRNILATFFPWGSETQTAGEISSIFEQFVE